MKFIEKKYELQDKITKLVLDFEEQEEVTICEITPYFNLVNEKRIEITFK